MTTACLFVLVWTYTASVTLDRNHHWKLQVGKLLTEFLLTLGMMYVMFSTCAVRASPGSERYGGVRQLNAVNEP